MLHFVLPKEYPKPQNPLVTFSAPSLSKSEHHALQTSLSDILSNLSSVEERLLEIIDSFTLSIPVSSENTSKAPLSQPSTIHSPDIIVLIWFHHLLSLTKRKAILALPLLCGISKPGYPGILILQGQKDIINDAIVKLRGMKWQAMQVRAEIENDNKLLENGIHEVENVAQVVERMERLGLGEWCLTALRMK
jgi:hypothetical protein